MTRLRIRSRHPSAQKLRGLVKAHVIAVYRHGSTTASEIKREVNSIQAVRTTSSKLLMKQSFDNLKVVHLPWFKLTDAKADKKGVTDGKTFINYPVVIKHYHGSRGEGNYKVDNEDEWKKCIAGKTTSLYIVEKFFSGCKEYRVHITAYGPIYCLRKMLKEETPDDKRWFRNDSNCVWITEKEIIKTSTGKFLRFGYKDNEKFNRPKCWDKIVEECKKSLKAVGLDLGACDIKVNKEGTEFYVIEINSAPSLGDITAEVYKQELPKILLNKYG